MEGLNMPVSKWCKLNSLNIVQTEFIKYGHVKPYSSEIFLSGILTSILYLVYLCYSALLLLLLEVYILCHRALLLLLLDVYILCHRALLLLLLDVFILCHRAPTWDQQPNSCHISHSVVVVVVEVCHMSHSVVIGIFNTTATILRLLLLLLLLSI